jgi:hypothetical protein
MIKSALRILPLLLLSTLLSAEQIQVRIDNRLSSDSVQSGTGFDGTLVNSMQIAGRSCAKGSPVSGVVTEAKSSGRVSSPGVLVLQPTWVSCSGRRVTVSAEPVRLEGKSHTKRNAVLIGGGAGAGAVLGGIMGGGKGALIGAAVGAGTGTVGAAATGKHEAVIEPEAIIAWNINGRSRVEDQRGHDSHHRSFQGNKGHRDGGDDDDDRGRGGQVYTISQHDRVYLQRCLVSNYRLPPGLAKQGKLPPGHAKKMQRAGYGEPIPGACTSELSPIPTGWERLIVENRVVLFDRSRREIDFFVWQD